MTSLLPVRLSFSDIFSPRARRIHPETVRDTSGNSHIRSTNGPARPVASADATANLAMEVLICRSDGVRQIETLVTFSREGHVDTVRRLQ